VALTQPRALAGTWWWLPRKLLHRCPGPPWTRAELPCDEVAVEDQKLWGHAGVDPALEHVCLFGALGPATRHRPIAQAFDHGRCVGLDVGVGPKVERPRHRHSPALGERIQQCDVERQRCRRDRSPCSSSDRSITAPPRGGSPESRVGSVSGSSVVATQHRPHAQSRGTGVKPSSGVTRYLNAAATGPG
jgi:hypothetical protein